jgi:hypothetical protein
VPRLRMKVTDMEVKYINKVSTSYPTLSHPIRSLLYYLILFHSMPCYPIPSYSISSYQTISVSSHLMSFYDIPSHPISSIPFLSFHLAPPILLLSSYLIPSYSTAFHSIPSLHIPSHPYPTHPIHTLHLTFHPYPTRNVPSCSYTYLPIPSYPIPSLHILSHPIPLIPFIFFHTIYVLRSDRNHHFNVCIFRPFVYYVYLILSYMCQCTPYSSHLILFHSIHPIPLIPFNPIPFYSSHLILFHSIPL